MSYNYIGTVALSGEPPLYMFRNDITGERIVFDPQTFRQNFGYLPQRNDIYLLANEINGLRSFDQQTAIRLNMALQKQRERLSNNLNSEHFNLFYNPGNRL